jgi:short-subunit dehydrogenase
VRGFGVDVILIEPGLIRTGFSDVIARDLGDSTSVDATYTEFNRAVSDASVRVYERGLLARLGGPPEAVAERIQQALEASRPRARYTVTASARVLLTLRALLPDAGWDRMLRSSFPTPRKR